MDSTIDETLKNGISDLTINQLRICGLPLKRHFNITETGRHMLSKYGIPKIFQSQHEKV